MKYPGSKWKLADWIISYFPKHHSYLEPFFGSGAVLFNKPRSNIETVNDLDNNVVNLFECIRENPVKLAGMVYMTPYAREVYERAFEEVPEDKYEAALNFYIRLNMGHGFRTSGERVGWKNDIQGRERAYAAQEWCLLPDKIIQAAERLRGVQIENRPAVELIKHFNYPHVYIPELSLILEKDVEEKFYIPDKKAKVIISQALKSLDKLRGCHAVITPGRENKRQNGRRAKGNEEPMFTLTAQDLHGVIQNVFLTTDKVAYCCDSSYPKGIGPGTRARRTHVVEYKNEKYLVRKLTPYEYGLLQGFPMDKWKQTVSDSQAYKLFGNAVTVNVSNAIAMAVHLFLKKL